MNNTSIEATLRIIEENRSKLIDLINSKMDELRQIVIEGDAHDARDIGGGRHEYEYPLKTPPSVFKGTKPTAVIFGDERVAVGTWRQVYTEILRRCNDDVNGHDALMSLRHRVSGRKREVISDCPDGMNIPIKLSEELYAEAYFDTEALVHTLTRRIFDAIRYDYSGITVAIIDRRSR